MNSQLQWYVWDFLLFLKKGGAKRTESKPQRCYKMKKRETAQKKFNVGRNWFSLQVMWSNTLQQCCCTLFKRDRSALIDRLLNICLQSIYAHGALWCISLRPQIRDLSNLYVQINIFNDFFFRSKTKKCYDLKWKRNILRFCSFKLLFVVMLIIYSDRIVLCSNCIRDLRPHCIFTIQAAIKLHFQTYLPQFYWDT